SCQINVVEKSFGKQHRLIRFTVKSMNQAGSTQGTKSQSHSQGSIFLITDIKADHRHNTDDQTLDPYRGEKVLCKDGLIHRSWLIVHNLRIVRLQSKSNGRKAVCQKIDKQQVYRCERYRQTGQGSIEYGQDTCKVSGKKE